MSIIERKNELVENIRKDINKNVLNNNVFIEDIRIVDNTNDIISLNKEYLIMFNLCGTKTYIDYNYNLNLKFEDILEDNNIKLIVNNFFNKINAVLN